MLIRLPCHDVAGIAAAIAEFGEGVEFLSALNSSPLFLITRHCLSGFPS